MALVARTAGVTDSVESHFEAALVDCRRTGTRLALDWSCADYAETLLDQDKPIDLQKVEGLVNEGATIARDLGMKPCSADLPILRTDSLPILTNLRTRTALQHAKSRCCANWLPVARTSRSPMSW